MKILIVSQYFWPENFRINAIVESLVDRGNKLDVLSGKPNYPKGQIFPGYRAWGCQSDSWKGAILHRVPLFPRGSKSSLRLLLNYLSFVVFGIIFSPWLLRKRRYDAIFVYGISPIMQAIPAIFIGWIKGCPVVLWVQDLWPDSLSATGYVKNKTILKLVECVVRFIYAHVDLLLVQSPAFIKPVQQLTKNTKVLYYPNSVNDSFSSPSNVEIPPLDKLGEGFSVMFAGNIGAAQGVDVIVEAADLLREHEDINFFVLGDGSCREEIVKAVQERSLSNFYLPGHFPVETMPGFMQKASVLLVTLTDQPIFHVTVPSKVQDYMAAGKPIVASLNGEGARLVVEAGAGLATPAGDGAALAETIRYLYKLNPEELKRMGSNGRQYYQNHFNHDSLVDQLLVHLQSVSYK